MKLFSAPTRKPLKESLKISTREGSTFGIEEIVVYLLGLGFNNLFVSSSNGYWNFVVDAEIYRNNRRSEMQWNDFFKPQNINYRVEILSAGNAALLRQQGQSSIEILRAAAQGIRSNLPEYQKPLNNLFMNFDMRMKSLPVTARKKAGIDVRLAQSNDDFDTIETIIRNYDPKELGKLREDVRNEVLNYQEKTTFDYYKILSAIKNNKIIITARSNSDFEIEKLIIEHLFDPNKFNFPLIHYFHEASGAEHFELTLKCSAENSDKNYSLANLIADGNLFNSSLVTWFSETRFDLVPNELEKSMKLKIHFHPSDEWAKYIPRMLLIALYRTGLDQYYILDNLKMPALDMEYRIGMACMPLNTPLQQLPIAKLTLDQPVTLEVIWSGSNKKLDGNRATGATILVIDLHLNNKIYKITIPKDEITTSRKIKFSFYENLTETRDFLSVRSIATLDNLKIMAWIAIAVPTDAVAVETKLPETWVAGGHYQISISNSILNNQSVLKAELVHQPTPEELLEKTNVKSPAAY